MDIPRRNSLYYVVYMHACAAAYAAATLWLPPMLRSCQAASAAAKLAATAITAAVATSYHHLLPQWRHTVAARWWRWLPRPCLPALRCQRAVYHCCHRRRSAGELPLPLLPPPPLRCRCASRHCAAADDSKLLPSCRQAAAKLPSWPPLL